MYNNHYAFRLSSRAEASPPRLTALPVETILMVYYNVYGAPRRSHGGHQPTLSNIER